MAHWYLCHFHEVVSFPISERAASVIEYSFIIFWLEWALGLLAAPDHVKVHHIWVKVHSLCSKISGNLATNGAQVLLKKQIPNHTVCASSAGDCTSCHPTIMTLASLQTATKIAPRSLLQALKILDVTTENILESPCLALGQCCTVLPVWSTQQMLLWFPWKLSVHL